MLKGFAAYLARCLDGPSVEFDRFELPSTDESVESVTVTCYQDKNLAVVVSFSSVASEEIAREIAQGISHRVLSELAFRYRLILESGPGGECFRDASDPAPIVPTTGWFSCTTAWKPIRIDADAIAELQARLASEPTPNDALRNDYRVALATADPVHRFISLYRLLYRLFPGKDGKEQQKPVDAFIVSEFSEPTTPRPDMPNVRETAFSRIRNELSHARPYADFEATRVEAEYRVDRLSVIVKRAIQLRA